MNQPDIINAIHAEIMRQDKGGKLSPATSMLKGMVDAKVKAAVLGPVSLKNELRAQLIEVCAVAFRILEGLS